MSRGGDEAIKRMADALRSGAKMLPEVCPVCSSPIFQIKGEMRCIACDKPVVMVRDEREAGRAMLPFVLSGLDDVIVTKVEELTTRLSRALEVDEISNIAKALDNLLSLLQRGSEVKERYKEGA